MNKMMKQEARNSEEVYYSIALTRMAAPSAPSVASPAALDGTEQLAHGLVLPPALEVLKEDVGVKENFHDLSLLLL